VSPSRTINLPGFPVSELTTETVQRPWFPKVLCFRTPCILEHLPKAWAAPFYRRCPSWRPWAGTCRISCWMPAAGEEKSAAKKWVRGGQNLDFSAHNHALYRTISRCIALYRAISRHIILSIWRSIHARACTVRCPAQADIASRSNMSSWGCRCTSGDVFW